MAQRRHRCAGVAFLGPFDLSALSSAFTFIEFARCSDDLSSCVSLLLVAVGWKWLCVRYGREIRDSVRTRSFVGDTDALVLDGRLGCILFGCSLAVA